MKESDWEARAESQCHQEWLGSSHPSAAHQPQWDVLSAYRQQPLLQLVCLRRLPLRNGLNPTIVLGSDPSDITAWGFGVAAVDFGGFFYIIVLKDGTDESLAKLKCFEPAGHTWKVISYCPLHCSETPSDLLTAAALQELHTWPLPAFVLSPQLGHHCFPLPFLIPTLFLGSVSSGWHTILFLAQVHQRCLCVLTVWCKHGLLPRPHTCSDCSVPSAVLLSASSPEFLRITEAQSLPRSKIICDPPALVPPQLRELQHFLADKKKSALLWGKYLIFALTDQCKQVVFNFVYLTVAV